MKYQNIISITLLFIILLSCEPFTGSGGTPELPPDELLAWVYRDFSGGMQCGGPGYTPPDVVRLLKREGVLVYKTSVEMMGICAACSCPSYAARHFALILKDNIPDAERVGFTLAGNYTGND